jgi:Rieske Fe-S protein
MNPRDPHLPRSVNGEAVPPDGGQAAGQPRWRRDFPIDWPEDDYVSRRDLVKFIVLTSAAFAAGQSWLVVKSWSGGSGGAEPAVAVATVDELPVGGAKTFAYPEGSPPRLLVRTGPETFVAYDRQCTHLLCPVVPAVERGQLHCPCHNGWFELETGRPLAGPPRRPLTRVLLDVRERTVYATGLEESGA